MSWQARISRLICRSRLETDVDALCDAVSPESQVVGVVATEFRYRASNHREEHL